MDNETFADRPLVDLYLLAKLHKHLPDPKLEEYIFNPTENLSAAEIVDKAERYVG